MVLHVLWPGSQTPGKCTFVDTNHRYSIKNPPSLDSCLGSRGGANQSNNLLAVEEMPIQHITRATTGVVVSALLK